MSLESAAPALFKPASVKPRATPVVPLLAALPIDPVQCSKALDALLAHVTKVQQQRELSDLLGEQEEKLLLVVGLKRAATREQHMPIRFALAHPVIDPKQSPVTLFVKDPQRTYKDLMESSKINFVSRVVGLDKLRNKHKTFEAKRLLLKEAELFLVDDRVMLEVGKALGKSWREAKKQPIPVALSRKDLKGELERAVAATYLQIGTGTSLAVKFGSTSIHSAAQLNENLLSLIPQLAVRLPHGGFENIQSLHIKTSTSISLPIYSVSLTAPDGRFSGPSDAEVKAIAGKQAEKDEKVKEKEAKVALREERRLEREAEKEKREIKMKADAEEKKVEKREKRKAAKEVQRAEGEDEEETLDADAPIVKKAKKSKAVAVVEEVMEVEEPSEAVVEVEVKVKKDKKTKKTAVVEEAVKPAKKAKRMKA